MTPNSRSFHLHTETCQQIPASNIHGASVQVGGDCDGQGEKEINSQAAPGLALPDKALLLWCQSGVTCQLFLVNVSIKPSRLNLKSRCVSLQSSHYTTGSGSIIFSSGRPLLVYAATYTQKTFFILFKEVIDFRLNYFTALPTPLHTVKRWLHSSCCL